jgi:hypothetical protein
MKRSFLHALAVCFVVGFFAGIFLLIAGNQIGGILVALACMIIAVLLLKAAEGAPDRKSTMLRFAGWLTGIVLGLALLAAIIVL